MISLKEFIDESYVTHKQRMHRANHAERSRARRASAAYVRPHRASSSGLTKKLNRHARITIMKRVFPHIKNVEALDQYQRATVKAFIDRYSKSIRAISSKIGKQKRDKRSDLKRLSQGKFNRYAIDTTGNYGSVT